MFDMFFTVIDSLFSKVMDWKSRQEESKEDLLKEVITPLFEEVQLCVEDYFIIFNQIKRELIADKKVNEDLSYFLAELRNQHLMKRIKVIEIADFLTREIKMKEILKLANSIKDFFLSVGIESSDDTKNDQTAISSYLDLLDQLEKDKTVSPENYSTVLESIDNTLMKMEKKWLLIVENYTKTRIRLLSMKSIKRLK